MSDQISNMETSGQNTSEQQLMSRLRQVILKEDRPELDYLKETIENPKLLSEKVTPIIEERLDFLKNNFPKEFQLAVNDIVERKLKASQDEILEIIYPTLGKMIKKYVQHQFQLLKESIDEQIRNTFNKGIIGRIRFALFGVKSKEISAEILSRLDKMTIEEIFVIEHHSGILLGSASRKGRVDLDMVAGMLTAIKAFVEDAFSRGEEQLEMVQYGTFTIYLQDFHSYYIATAITGSLSAAEKDQLLEDLIEFAKNELSIQLKKEDGSSNQIIKQKLETYFIKPQLAVLPEGNLTK
ncbi:MAG: hypothetical protein P1U70_00050 [Saprospiraceae bacterium]|jgi:hypothetical protein|nr:hypothetical protein [Saprospiraceae bacterium]